MWPDYKAIDQRAILNCATKSLCTGAPQEADCQRKWAEDKPSIVREGANNADVYFPTPRGTVHSRVTRSQEGGDWHSLGWSVEPADIK